MPTVKVRSQAKSDELLDPELRRNVKRFRGGLVFKAHRLVYDSTLGSRCIKKKKQKKASIQSYLLENDVALVEVVQRAQCDEEVRPVAVRDLKVRHRGEKRFIGFDLPRQEREDGQGDHFPSSLGSSQRC